MIAAVRRRAPWNLQMAIFQRDEPRALEFLDSRPHEVEQPAPDGSSYFVEACGRNMLGLVKAMLRIGVPPDKPDDKGETGIVRATVENLPEMAALLLDHDARPDPVENPAEQVSPLFLAAQQGYTGVVDELIRHGANTRMAFLKVEWTPLMAACSAGRIPSAVRLAPVSDLEAVSCAGESALAIAERRGHACIADLLRSVRIRNQASGVIAAIPAAHPVLASHFLTRLPR